MIARRLGHRVLLLEKGKHPRFAIGESSTPLANLLLEELSTKYDLPAVMPLCKWGSWQRSYPNLACGLKRGFTFYHHEFDKPWSPQTDRRNQLLVAASPHDEIADIADLFLDGPSGEILPKVVQAMREIRDIP